MKHPSLVMSSSRLQKSCLKATPPPAQPPFPSSTTLPAITNPRSRSLRWNEPIARFREIPAKEDDYYTTFQELPFDVNAEDQEEDEPHIPFLRSQRTHSKPVLSDPEPAWLKSIVSTSEGGDSNIYINTNVVSEEQVVCGSLLSELDDITLIELGDCTSPAPLFSPPAQDYCKQEVGQRLENYALFMNLNPGYGILNEQLKHLTLEPILQEQMQNQADQVLPPSLQHFRNIIGDAVAPTASSDPVATRDSPRAPLATLQINTPSASPGPGTSTPSQIWDNSYPRSPPEHNFHPDFHPNQPPVHSIPANHKNYAKPSQVAAPTFSQFRSSPSEGTVTPAHPQHHHAHTSNSTAPIPTGLGAYSKHTNTQPPLPAGVNPTSLPPLPTAAPHNAVASTSAQTQSAKPNTNAAPSRAEVDALGDDVDMEPPASESESEEGEILEDEGDQFDELFDDEGEIRPGQSGLIGSALRSHVDEFRESQANGVNSSSASERRQDARRDRRANVLGLGAIGRGGRVDTSERTGTGASRLGGAVARRARAVHVPSIAGHIQHPPIATLESTLVHPPKQYYPLPIVTVHSWRTELERLASLCTRPGVWKNPSQYAAELSRVVKEIEENEEHPDLTAEVLLETRLMQVLKLFQHCNGDAGPGIRSLKPRVIGICRRWRERLRLAKMNVDGNAQ